MTHQPAPAALADDSGPAAQLPHEGDCSGVEECAGPLVGALPEGCPAPLSLPQVLEAFRDDSDYWQFEQDGRLIRGRTWGAGPPLYFLNGLGGTHELFAPAVWLLREHFTCVSHDYAGSHGGKQPASVEELTADVLEIADRQGHERFDIYATSFGGLVALETMRTAPYRVQRAILQGTFARRRLSMTEAMLARVMGIAGATLARIPGREAVQRHNHRPWFPASDQSRWPFFLENAGKVPVRALAARGRIIGRTDLRSSLPQISTPVLVIQSEGEGLVSSECNRELVAGLPNLATEYFENCGHLPYLSHPHRLAKVIRAFLDAEVPSPVEQNR